MHKRSHLLWCKFAGFQPAIIFRIKNERRKKGQTTEATAPTLSPSSSTPYRGMKPCSPPWLHPRREPRECSSSYSRSIAVSFQLRPPLPHHRRREDACWATGLGWRGRRDGSGDGEMEAVSPPRVPDFQVSLRPSLSESLV